MKKLTTANLVSALAQLDKNVRYDYPNPKNKGKIEIVRVQKPEGPIVIRRYDPSKGQSSKNAKDASISPHMLARFAAAVSESRPINMDRVLGASYNTRSALEALLLHTPEFYTCYPGRIELLSSSTNIKKGHKHLLWMPDEPHNIGGIHSKDVETYISEVSSEVVYEALELPEALKTSIDIEISRRHAQMQIALIMIGQQLGFRTWIAQNDKGIVYRGEKIGTLKSVIQTLGQEPLLQAYSEAVKAALLIDCIWFRNGKFMPAVIEIEHSTGVTSGLTRMKNFYDHIPRLQDMRWVIVAPDEDRQKVVTEACKPQFQDLKARYMPYSAVEELYSLCSRRGIKGVSDTFLDCFMEECV